MPPLDFVNPDAAPGPGEDANSQPPLVRALDQSEQVKVKVEECAADLSSVNLVLAQEIGEGVPLRAVEDALEKSEGIEAKVQECADDLALVNDALAEEIDGRHLLEHQLSESDAALTQSRLDERRARHRALHDAMTGLPNMTLFEDRLAAGLMQAQRHGWRLAVLFLDLDRFKSINDTHGHATGDGALQLVATRLEQFVRAADTVSRRSGDEFLVLMLEAKDEDSVATFARKIAETIAEPWEVGGTTLTLTPSVGIAIFPEDGRSASELLANADTAMYSAKASGGGVMLYSRRPTEDASGPPAGPAAAP